MGVDVGVRVAVGGIAVAVGVEVPVEVDVGNGDGVTVGVGATVDPRNCPGLQLANTKPMTKRTIVAFLCFMHMVTS
jgi:hypothetical protein